MRPRRRVPTSVPGRRVFSSTCRACGEQHKRTVLREVSAAMSNKSRTPARARRFLTSSPTCHPPGLEGRVTGSAPLSFLGPGAAVSPGGGMVSRCHDCPHSCVPLCYTLTLGAAATLNPGEGTFLDLISPFTPISGFPHRLSSTCHRVPPEIAEGP